MNGEYERLTLNDIRESDFKKIEDKLKEEKLPYKIGYKVPSSKEGIIKRFRDFLIIPNKNS